ncbi:zinc ribbon domain-containing protein [Burkholderia sp. Ac-20353]|uniref:zinc ribbon domain-containing protein n=1 Tax=Burkholderia sp. Ac-20353 TaxID=2703894 RepID=UPI00197C01A6|nr:zinc ribbon domain-containing protein [Burkholderia sp. Ac-20353]MBN3790273.1 serine endopeptidase [Burkholderia sp. Ac-20353]
MTISTKGLRLAEVWFQRALWIIAMVFAGFLIGLGGLIVGDLPRVEQTPDRDTFIDQQAAAPLRATLAKLAAGQTANRDATEQATLLLTAAEQDTQQAREAFRAVIASRHATERAEQDPAVIAHAHALEAATQRERDAQARIGTLKQAAQALDRQEGATRQALGELEAQADSRLEAAQRQQELRVFGIRLLFTVPLLLIAGWLFAKKRGGRYWPFVWGFIFFALFAFFVELVPYLPSYGGYVRYIVGIVLTVAVGQYAIRALSRYLEQKRREEQQPDLSRREALDFVTAYARIAKKVCPGCERPLDTTDPNANFCPHCGICAFNACARCDTRKNAFSRFCPACGTSADTAVPPTPAA